MNRIVKIFLILVVCFSFKTVYAENYKLKELIPYNVDTTIHTDNFSYKGIRFDEEGVHFNGIKNLTDKKLPISVSIGIFDKRGINIGTINYCDIDLEGKTEMSFLIEFSDKYLAKNKKIEDIKYIALLGDNINCRTKGSTDYVGQDVDKLGITHKEKLDKSTELFLSILTVVAGAFLVFIVYKLIFTRAYRNMNGNDVRKAYESINKELKEMREEEEKNKEEPIEEFTKSQDIIDQENNAKNEEKENTDLHNMYK